jgi:uncharacterized repeat protein (TIGR03803 family)
MQLPRFSLTAALLLVLTAVPYAHSSPKYKVLHAFTGGKDGGGLWSSLTFHQAGNLYGTTSGDGAYGYGTVFELTQGAAGQWSETVLYSFHDPYTTNDGGIPFGSVVFDPSGNLYGTTSKGGGPSTWGTVYKLTPGSGSWTETIIHGFGPHDHAGGPYAGLIIDEKGDLYGIAGAAFELMRGSNGWKEKILYEFCSKQNCSDGNAPFAGLIFGASGDLYGTTEAGGAHKAGTVYQIRHTAGGWKESVLHSFPALSSDGQVPGVGALVSDGSGSLYGTTSQGGSHICIDVGCGTVFRLVRETGHWTETILYNFVGDKKGSGPGAGVVMDKKGNLYGTTVYGGSTLCGCGVVYKLSPSSNGKWKYTVLHTFTGSDGAQPDANLILDSKGNLYGTTATGGAGGAGVAFELTP